jgi:ATP-dependent DNA helicase DinG
MINEFFQVDEFPAENYIFMMPKSFLTTADILGPEGLLARSLEGFEFRPSQVDMASQIEEALIRKTPALVEAGTGIGKTFGYLVPLILSGKKVVISTGTKNLQEQIYFKDIPLLRAATGLKPDAMMMKGRKNYLCLHRYHQLPAQESFLKARGKALQGRMEKWLKETRFADRAELPWLADDTSLWDELSCSSEQCLGTNCLYFENCFLNELRRAAARSSIIIVNHHLFFADLKIKRSGFGEVIPRFQVVVFDEAHNVEETATDYLGESISTNQLAELVSDLEKETKTLQKAENAHFNMHLAALKSQIEYLRHWFDSGENRERLDTPSLDELRRKPGREVRAALKKIALDLEERAFEKLQAYTIRAQELHSLLALVLESRESDWLTWYERRNTGITLHASPLDISERLKSLLYTQVETTIFTSATLSTNGTFDYFKSRLGLSEAVEAIYPSHFDFNNHCLLYIPRDLPLPSSPHFPAAIAGRILEILERTRGRALVLFTSYHNLNMVHTMIRDKVPYALQRQGDAPRSTLLDAFRKDVHSVLLATGSFWQGVDVPGEALSCVIVDKLPFDSPGDPLVAARIEAITSRGGNSFFEYQVPSAIISLKQGLGRLIRKATDRGVLSVLDNRINTKPYGKLFLESLPEIPLTRDLADIKRFFEQQDRKPAGKCC